MSGTNNPISKAQRYDFYEKDFFTIEERQREHAQKILLAVYLVTKTIDDPIQKKVREEALSFFHLFQGETLLVHDFLKQRMKLGSYLSLLAQLNYISQEHVHVFERELRKHEEMVVKSIKREDDVLSKIFSQEEKKERESSLYGEKRVVPSPLRIEKIRSQKEKREKKNDHVLRRAPTEKEKRHEEILHYMRGKDYLSLPEITRVFSAYSSKTIQRDLKELIDQGKVERKGERRWAMYKTI